MWYRMMYLMKVTAIIPDSLINDVKKLSKGKNITESLIVVLQEWIDLQKLRGVGNRIRRNPVKFISGFTAENIRAFNRKR